MDQSWEKIQEALIASSEMPEADFVNWLEKFCEGDEKLKSEVESFLPLEPEIDNFLEKGVGSYVAQIFLEENSLDEETDLINKTFGHYKIIREIGHGGMGAVFLASRIDGEFEHQVAIKIVRQTIADRETINRFKRERQILASLNHPNIAKLVDGGISPDGLPFLAMEFVEGEAITDFVERENLNLEERLKLFQKVCAAVTYAHRNLTVHRDLKPSNIMVTKDGEPKLLDFGLAKLVDENLSSDSAQTQTAFQALTPAYASPEQLKGEPITTASDIYSLGVILYELLTNERPFQFEGKKLAQIIKTITDHNPMPPSVMATSKSGKDKENPKSQIPNPKSLRGDLDNIVLMALRREPERRYRSVEQFAEDIDRYLKELPVLARPNTYQYRAAKFINRHKYGVIAAILILLSLITGIVIAIWQARAVQREKEKAQTVNLFLSEMLNYSDPNTAVKKGEGEVVTIKEILDKAANQLNDENFSGQPEIKAELNLIIGYSYNSQGFYEQAEKHARSALEEQIKLYGAKSPEVIKTKLLLAEVLGQRANILENEPLFRETLPMARAEFQKGNLKAKYLAEALHNFAVTRRALGNSKEAEDLIREGLLLEPLIPEKEKGIVTLLQGTLALTLFDQGKIDEAIEAARKNIRELRQTPQAGTPSFGYALTALGSYTSEKENFAEAEAALSEAETIYRRLLDNSHLWLGDNLRIQANTLYNRGRFVEAQNKITETLKIYRANTGTKYINFPTALIIQGLILNQTGKSTEAEKILREAVRIREENLPNNHFLTALAKSALGECLLTQKKLAEAEPLLRESYENLKLAQGENNPRTVLAKSRLEKLEQETKKP